MRRTLEWNHTTVVIVRARAAGKIGVGYTYADIPTANLIKDMLIPLVQGKSAMDVPARWAEMRHAIRNLGRPGICSMAIAAVDAIEPARTWHGEGSQRRRMLTGESNPRSTESVSPPFDLKNGLDLHGDSSRQCDHADGTSRPDARVAEYVFHQIRIAVDDLGVLAELGRRIDHPQALDQPLNLVKRAQVGPKVDRIASPVCRAAA